MKLNVVLTGQFTRDFKKVLKRGKARAKIEDIVDSIADRKPLPLRCNDHPLTGNYVDHRECHIEPDWLLIYRIEETELILVRTGGHSDLFK